MSLGASLSMEEVPSTLSLLCEFADVFTLSHVEMSTVLPELAEHWLSLQDNCRSIRQRLRLFHPAQQEVIKQEVDKLLEADFIKEIQFP